MEHEEISDGAARTGVATYVVEAVVAALLLIIGLVVVFEARKLGAGWTSDGPGSGYFPFFIGVIITISGAGILYQALLGKNRNTEVFVDSVQLKRVLSVLVPATVYVLAITFVGLYVASAIYIALFMIVLGKYSWGKSVIAALAVNTVFFCMFEVWFKVPLFKGALDPLRFLGY
ncbi:tripartite tricarboxylate transporter TctB family protein [Variovorax sp. IB41]|uniref:tripartite tricarboxylate transporter TctB family protein n=1 Tax=Variovorax sp. IB41 TaxID=2779370 RepID=UPI0018E71753|nr:tripartite tricarboxylate transporter TctB family protein [Variovorax sp. IB41]MBJ2157130.1 tripartite tricarboxylate transporter TctB family protein [Variovorax sp. IB41]